MDSKLYVLAIICLVGGLVGGYLIASTTFQNQNTAYEIRIQSLNAEVTAKDALIQAKDAQMQAQDLRIQAQDAQLKAQDVQIQAQSILIQTQEGLLQDLKANITKLQELIQLISDQVQTQVRVDSITWSTGSFTLDVRNTGNINVMIESISIRVNQAGSEPTVLSTSVITKSILSGLHILLGPASYNWTPSTSYVIRVTTNVSVYYEAIFISPAT